MKKKKIYEVAQFLYQLLDDIDTAGDMAKSNNIAYRNMVEKIQSKKKRVVADCDGYTVKLKPLKNKAWGEACDESEV